MGGTPWQERHGPFAKATTDGPRVNEPHRTNIFIVPKESATVSRTAQATIPHDEARTGRRHSWRLLHISRRQWAHPPADRYPPHKRRRKPSVVCARSLKSVTCKPPAACRPERALAEQIGVSRRAIRHALDMLEAEGRITRQQGRGTLICGARTEALDLSNRLATLADPARYARGSHGNRAGVARLAALRATQGDFDKLFEAADASRVAKDADFHTKRQTPRFTVASQSPRVIHC